MTGSGAAIAHYYLYGEHDPDVERDFLHVEPIPARSAPNDWTFRPHFHPDHTQFMMLSRGGGEIRMEDRVLPLSPPGLILIPAGTVHEIRFAPATDGFVVTVALPYLHQAALGDQRLAEAATRAGYFPVAGTGVSPEAALETFDWLHREFIWSAPARRTAIFAHFLRILVLVLRLQLSVAHQASVAVDRNLDLLTRYRALLESHFRNQRGLDFYSGALAITTPRLNAACRARAGRTASDLLFDRILTEAKRYLVYTNLSVAEAGNRAGFDDPGYFNRFFSKRVGMTPRAYRLAMAGQEKPEA